MRRSGLLITIVLCAGCAASHGGEEARRFLDELDAEICERAVRCEGELGTFWSRDAQFACHPSFWLGWLDGADREVSLGRAGFDASAARACLEELREIPCRSADPLPPSTVSCGGVFTPMAREGDDCDPLPYFDACEPGLFCARTDGCLGVCVRAATIGESCAARPCAPGSRCSFGEVVVCVASTPLLGEPCTDVCGSLDGRVTECEGGVCVIARERALGEPCGTRGPPCESGAFCDDGVCAARGGLGASCDWRDACVDGLRCTGGACAALGVAGDECMGDLDCESSAPFCPPTEDPAGPRCTADPTGASCSGWVYGVFHSSRDSCPAGFACVSARCAPIAAIGGACGDGVACGGASRCVDDRCVAVVRVGEACGAEAVCPQGQACRAGRCEALPDVGEACVDACVRGVCTDGACALRADGAACEPSLPGCAGVCGEGSVCVEGVPEGGECGARIGRCATGMQCVADAEGRGACVRPECAPSEAVRVP